MSPLNPTLISPTAAFCFEDVSKTILVLLKRIAPLAISGSISILCGALSYFAGRERGE